MVSLMTSLGHRSKLLALLQKRVSSIRAYTSTTPDGAVTSNQGAI